MYINILDIAKQKLCAKGIDISGCEIMHECILSDNTASNAVDLEDIEASNEYFFLLTELKEGTIITSDEDILVINDALKEKLLGKSILMFTGTIRITVPANTKQLIEFMRIKPINQKNTNR